VLGAMAATVAVSVALGLNRKQSVDALGIAGSMAGGIIEYLAEGAWTKRLHAGWAARVGLHAARIAREGFLGPRTVFEGTHGLFFGFAHTASGDFDALTGDFGSRWVLTDITFKPYATGDDEPALHRLCVAPRQEGLRRGGYRRSAVRNRGRLRSPVMEPLASKHHPANDYAAKFSAPFNIAVAFVTGKTGFDAFTEKTVRDARVLELAAKVRYVVDPNNPYPKAYTGHVRMTLKDGRVFEERQPHIRAACTSRLRARTSKASSAPTLPMEAGAMRRPGVFSTSRSGPSRDPGLVRLPRLDPAVQPPVLNGFGHVSDADRRLVPQIGDGASELEHPW